MAKIIADLGSRKLLVEATQEELQRVQGIQGKYSPSFRIGDEVYMGMKLTEINNTINKLLDSYYLKLGKEEIADISRNFAKLEELRDSFKGTITK